jgi:hypothetical protein
MSKVTVIPGTPHATCEFESETVTESDDTRVTVRRERMYPAVPERFVVEMSREQAEIVCALLGSISGWNLPRQVADDLWLTLSEKLPDRVRKGVRLSGCVYRLTNENRFSEL